MQINYNERLNRLLDNASADVVAIIPGANLVYFTGLHYHRSERPTIAFISRDGLSFIMPRLEMSKLEQRPDLNARAFQWTDEAGYVDSFKTAVETLGLDKARLGVDGMTMRVFEWLALQNAGANMAQAVDVGQDLLNVRAIKTADEIDALRRAVQLSEAALEKTLPQVKIGMTELEIAAVLEQELKNAGSDALAFGTIVLTGPKSALPHGNTGTRQLQNGDFLLFDFGGMKDEYPADITRTFMIGDPTDQQRAIYEAVKEANAAARAIAAPGVLCSAVDKAARDVITAAGFGDYFTHRTGHGLGLEGHELPQISATNDVPLETGMVFTIEPGVYVPEVGGVRIEDNMIVTATGAESLTSFPRELM